MLLADLIDDFRDYTRDINEPYLWPDTLVKKYADRAEIEACERRPLLTSSTDADMCVIDVTADTALYTKHKAVREVYYAKFETATDQYNLRIVNIDELNFIDPDWDMLESYPRYLLLTDTEVQLVPVPTEDGTLTLSISHIPKTLMSAKEAPEVLGPTIDEAHHYNLLYWMLHLGYMRRDTDTFDPKKALDYEQMFIAYFGDRKGVNSLKSVRTVRNDRTESTWI